MLIYVTALILTIIFINFAAYYYNKQKRLLFFVGGNKNLKKDYAINKLKYCAFFVLAFFPLFFISAVRYDIGTDYFYTYVPNFYKILQGIEDVYAEKGFVWINKFIQIFTDDYQWVFVITSFVFIGYLINSVIKYSSNVTISILVAFISCVFFISLNNVRQAVAAIIIMAAYPYIQKGDVLYFTFYVFCAIIFHITAILMVAPFILINLKFFKKYFELCSCILLVALPLVCAALKAVLKNTKYYYYFISHFNSGDVSFIYILFHLILFIVAYFLLKNKIKSDNRAFLLLVMQFCAFYVSASGLFIRIPEMITRIVLYFQTFHIYLVPYCYSIQKSNFLKAFVLFGYTAMYGYYLIKYIILLGYHEVLPYKWIFNTV